MRLTGWCFWQPFDTGNWGLIQCNTWDRWIGQPLRKYYVFAHYTRHIRAGMTILDGFQDDTVVAYDKAARKLVLVTMNYNVTNNITYNLTNFFKVAGPVRRWKTELGNTNATYAQFNDIVVSNRTFQASFAADTIQSFEIENVDLYPPALSISSTADPKLVTLSWPTNAAGFNLYTTANLAGAVTWELVTNTIAISNGSFYVLLSNANSNERFFRLSNP